LSDSEDEDPSPCIASYMAQENNCAHIVEASNIATKANTAQPHTVNPLPENEEEKNPQLANPDWQALINSQTQAVDPKQVKSGYIDYSEVGWLSSSQRH